MALVAFIIEPASVKPILEHLGLPTEPPRVALARADRKRINRQIFVPAPFILDRS